MGLSSYRPQTKMPNKIYQAWHWITGIDFPVSHKDAQFEMGSLVIFHISIRTHYQVMNLIFKRFSCRNECDRIPEVELFYLYVHWIFSSTTDMRDKLVEKKKMKIHLVKKYNREKLFETSMFCSSQSTRHQNMSLLSLPLHFCSFLILTGFPPFPFLSSPWKFPQQLLVPYSVSASPSCHRGWLSGFIYSLVNSTDRTAMVGSRASSPRDIVPLFSKILQYLITLASLMQSPVPFLVHHPSKRWTTLISHQ